MSSTSTFDFDAVARAALSQVHDLLPRWFPAGRMHGREFRVGDLSGKSGESLAVNTQTGEWADFSTDDRGRDLISLYAAINRLKNLEAAKQLSDILGGRQTATRSARVTPIPTPESPEWDGIFPIPGDAPPPPAQHPQYGLPVHIANYRDTGSRLMALVYRCEPAGQRKQVIPLTYCRNTRTGHTEWRWQALPKPRSLYRAELLSQFEGAPVLLVEGEPKCDAANASLPENWIALSWSNGANSWKQADWSMLAGRHVTIWPDADAPGVAAAKQIAEQLPHYGAKCHVLAPPDGSPEGWDIGDAIRDGWDASRLMAFIAPQPIEQRPLWHHDEAWDEADIPRRPWLAKGYALRGAVTLVAGAGSIGKSTLFKAWSVAAVLGVSFSRFEVAQPLRVLSYNVEDDLDEERRRLSATLRQFNATPKDLAGKLRIVGTDDVGVLIERDPATGRVQLTEKMLDLIRHIEEFQPDIVFLDPLVELHTSEENDNTGLRSVIAQLRTIAVRFKIAMVLAHHVRKGAVTPGDPDGIRGAGSIVGAARITFTVCGMSEEEAGALAIGKEVRRSYFRLDGAKMNYVPIEDVEWFERVAYRLDNGEEVASAIKWTPPRDAITTTDIETIKSAINRGLNGEPYCFRSGYARSLGNLCRDNGVSTDAGLKEIANALKTEGYEEHSYMRSNRTAAKGIRAPDGGPHAVTWE